MAIWEVARNHPWGHFNRSSFWRLLTPGAAREPRRLLEAQLRIPFGSGQAWLTLEPGGRLRAVSTADRNTL